jgi:hypothetical protein
MSETEKEVEQRKEQEEVRTAQQFSLPYKPCEG